MKIVPSVAQEKSDSRLVDDFGNKNNDNFEPCLIPEGSIQSYYYVAGCIDFFDKTWNSYIKLGFIVDKIVLRSHESSYPLIEKYHFRLFSTCEIKFGRIDFKFSTISSIHFLLSEDNKLEGAIIFKDNNYWKF